MLLKNVNISESETKLPHYRFYFEKDVSFDRSCRMLFCIINNFHMNHTERDKVKKLISQLLSSFFGIQNIESMEEVQTEGLSDDFIQLLTTEDFIDKKFKGELEFNIPEDQYITIIPDSDHVDMNIV